MALKLAERVTDPLWRDFVNFTQTIPPGSAASMTVALRQFLTFFKLRIFSKHGAEFLTSCGQVEITSFTAGLHKRHLAPATIRTYLAELATVFKQLHRLGHRDLLHVELPRNCEQIKPTKTIPFELVHSGICAALQRETYADYEDAAVWALGFGGALRVSEILGLAVSDISRTAEGVTVLRLRRTKAQKSADVPIGEFAGWVIGIWIRARALAFGADPAGRLFPDLNYKKLAARYFKHFKAAPHSMRKTAITKLLSDGVPMDDVRRFARLSSFRMVVTYDGQIRDLQQSAGLRLKF